MEREGGLLDAVPAAGAGEGAPEPLLGGQVEQEREVGADGAGGEVVEPPQGRDVEAAPEKVCASGQTPEARLFDRLSRTDSKRCTAACG